MGSHAQDASTQKAASTGAEAQDQQLATNAAKNQQYADQTRTSLFGNYDPSTGKYSGGSTSQFLDPSTLNQTGLSGTYLNQYNNASNTVANNTKNAVGTTMTNLAQRGMGKTPAGFAADQERKAYQDQASTLGSLYSTTAGTQHSDAQNNYWNATNLLNSNASQTANLSVQGNTAAAGNYSSLYGTASQQVASPLATALGTVAGLGSAAGSVMTGIGGSKGVCWVAAELYGGWFEPRTVAVRKWIFGPFQKRLIGRILGKLYMRFGKQVAESIKTNRPLRAVMQFTFDKALKAAQEGR